MIESRSGSSIRLPVLIHDEVPQLEECRLKIVVDEAPDLIEESPYRLRIIAVAGIRLGRLGKFQELFVHESVVQLEEEKVIELIVEPVEQVEKIGII